MKLFLDDADRNKYLSTLSRFKKNKEYELYAYCLMDNHVHLLLQEGKEAIPRSMKRIGVSYSYYYNKKYERVGHLFQDRFRSEIIENDKYLLACARYIHKNPVKAGIVQKAEEYQWSSYQEYLGQTAYKGLVDTQFLLQMYSESYEKAIEEMQMFTEIPAEDVFLDDDSVKREEQLYRFRNAVIDLLEKYGVKLEDIKEMEKDQRKQIIREIKKITNGSGRELAKILGISKDVIYRA